MAAERRNSASTWGGCVCIHSMLCSESCEWSAATGLPGTGRSSPDVIFVVLCAPAAVANTKVIASVRKLMGPSLTLRRREVLSIETGYADRGCTSNYRSHRLAERRYLIEQCRESFPAHPPQPNAETLAPAPAVGPRRYNPS